MKARIHIKMNDGSAKEDVVDLDVSDFGIETIHDNLLLVGDGSDIKEILIKPVETEDSYIHGILAQQAKRN